MIDIFGLKLPDGLFYAMIVAGAIFYSFMMWFLLQLLRRKMPTRVYKLGLGQSMEEFKGREDDNKIYWKEGFYGKEHSVAKDTKPRLKTNWGRMYKHYLVREDHDKTIPFAKIDELKGSSTEAHSKRRNEDFVDSAGKLLRKIAKGDALLFLLFGVTIGTVATWALMIVSGIISFA